MLVSAEIRWFCSRHDFVVLRRPQQMGQDFPRGVLVQPEASWRPNSRERSSELASDKLY